MTRSGDRAAVCFAEDQRRPAECGTWTLQSEWLVAVGQCRERCKLILDHCLFSRWE